MEPVLATVNINIGLGKDNPVLTIRSGDDLSAMVDRLISDYQLPKKVHSIIMARVQDQIPQTPASTVKTKQNAPKTTLGNKNKSISPLRTNTPSSTKLINKRPIVSQKENIQNISNWAS